MTNCRQERNHNNHSAKSLVQEVHQAGTDYRDLPAERDLKANEDPQGGLDPLENLGNRVSPGPLEKLVDQELKEHLDYVDLQDLKA